MTVVTTMQVLLQAVQNVLLLSDLQHRFWKTTVTRRDVTDVFGF